MDKNQNAVSIFNQLAATYQDKFMNVDLYANTFDLFCDNIPNKGTILELACGPGNITKYFLDQRPDLKILGTDLSDNMIALAKINNPSADFQIMDCRKISQLTAKYNGIVCGFCLPYLSKEETKQLIFDSSNLLYGGGLLYLSTMEDKYEKSRLQQSSSGDAIFIHYYETDDLVEILESNHFQILFSDKKQYRLNEIDTTDLILIAQKPAV